MNRVALFAVLLIFATTASGRLIRAWTYQELTAASDLVLIATPTATADTKEEAGLPGMASVRVTGVDTHFTVLTVLKGDAKLKDITVHHYRVTKGVVVDNGPMLRHRRDKPPDRGDIHETACHHFAACRAHRIGRPGR